MRSARLGPPLLLVIISVSGCGTCGGGDDAPPDDDPYPHASVPVSCDGAWPASEVFPLGSDPESFFLAVRSGEGVADAPRRFQSTRGAVTRDGGRTYAVVPVAAIASAAQPNVLEASALGGRRDIAAVDADLFSSMRPFGQGGTDPRGNPLDRTVVIDGAGIDVRGTPGGATVPGGAADMTWKPDAMHWFARRGFHLFGTRDAGATWHDAGLVPELYLEAGELLVPLGARGELVLVEDRTDVGRGGPFFLVDGSAAPVEIPLSGALGRDAPGGRARMRFWGERLVFLDFSRFWTSGDRGATWQPLASLQGEGEAHQFDAVEDSAGNLYVFPVFDDLSDAPVYVYRYAPGADTPTVIDLDFAPLDVHQLAAPHALPGGRLRFVANPTLTRESYAGIVCEMGPGVTPAITTPLVESLAVAAASDRVVRIARLKDLDDLGDRMAVSPAGRAFGGAYQAVLARPPDVPALYDGTSGNVPQDDLGVVPSAFAAAGEWWVDAFLHGDPRPTALTTFDARTGTYERFAYAFTGPAYAATMGDRGVLIHTDRGAIVQADLVNPVPPSFPPPASFPAQLVTDGPHAAVVSSLARDRLAPELGDGWVIRFDPWRERIPDLQTCLTVPTPAACIAAPEMSAIAAQFDLDGNLYVLDLRRSRVMMLEAGTSTWHEVARGFLSPTDLIVRRMDGAWVALVYDGDVFAFAATPGTTKVRGAAAPPARRDRAVVADRDLHDCTASGPCLDDTSDEALELGDGATPVCVGGRSLGAGGKVFAGAVEMTVTAWSDGQVCARAPGAALVDGLLQIVRDDGEASNTLPFRAAGTVASWNVPSTAYPDTVITAAGANLGSSRLGPRVQEGDRYAIWALPAGANDLVIAKAATLATRRVNVVPRVFHGCRAGRAQWCTIYGTGFGTSGTATIGGLTAEVKAWSPSAVALAWPAALSPGLHAVSLSGNGFTGDAQVELLADAQAPLVLQHDAPFTAAFAYRHPRPVELSRGLFANLDSWQLTTVNGEPSPMGMVAGLVEPDSPETILQMPGQPLGARATGFHVRLEPTRPVHPIELGGDLYAAGSKYQSTTRAMIYRLDPVVSGNGSLSYTTTTIAELVNSAAVQVAAVGELGGKVLVAMSSQLGNTTDVVAVTISGGTGTAGTPVRITGSFGFGGGAEPVSHGAFFAGGGIYVTSCRVPSAGARVEYAALALDGGGALQAQPQSTVLDAPTARLLACNTTPQGLIWVQRDAALHRVYAHAPGAAPTLLVTVPASLPGVGDLFSFSNDQQLPGVTDVALLPDGDVLLLLDEHDLPGRGLHLARWDSSAGTWSQIQVVQPAATWQRGEVCMGPHLSTFSCPAVGRDGCAPNACTFRPPEVRPLATSQIGEAYMVVRGNEVSIVYEAIDPARRPYGNIGGSDVLHVKVPLLP